MIFRYLLIIEYNEIGILIINDYVNVSFLPLIASLAEPRQYSPYIFEYNCINSIKINKILKLSWLKVLKVQIGKQKLGVGLGKLF